MSTSQAPLPLTEAHEAMMASLRGSQLEKARTTILYAVMFMRFQPGIEGEQKSRAGKGLLGWLRTLIKAKEEDPSFVLRDYEAVAIQHYQGWKTTQWQQIDWTIFNLCNLPGVGPLTAPHPAAGIPSGIDSTPNFSTVTGTNLGSARVDSRLEIEGQASDDEDDDELDEGDVTIKVEPNWDWSEGYQGGQANEMEVDVADVMEEDAVKEERRRKKGKARAVEDHPEKPQSNTTGTTGEGSRSQYTETEKRKGKRTEVPSEIQESMATRSKSRGRKPPKSSAIVSQKHLDNDEVEIDVSLADRKRKAKSRDRQGTPDHPAKKLRSESIQAPGDATEAEPFRHPRGFKGTGGATNQYPCSRCMEQLQPCLQTGRGASCEGCTKDRVRCPLVPHTSDEVPGSGAGTTKSVRRGRSEGPKKVGETTSARATGRGRSEARGKSKVNTRAASRRAGSQGKFTTGEYESLSVALEPATTPDNVLPKIRIRRRSLAALKDPNDIPYIPFINLKPTSKRVEPGTMAEATRASIENTGGDSSILSDLLHRVKSMETTVLELKAENQGLRNVQNEIRATVHDLVERIETVATTSPSNEDLDVARTELFNLFAELADSQDIRTNRIAADIRARDVVTKHLQKTVNATLARYSDQITSLADLAQRSLSILGPQSFGNVSHATAESSASGSASGVVSAESTSIILPRRPQHLPTSTGPQHNPFATMDPRQLHQIIPPDSRASREMVQDLLTIATSVVSSSDAEDSAHEMDEYVQQGGTWTWSGGPLEAG